MSRRGARTDQLILFAEASPVRTSRSRGRGKDSAETEAGSGTTSRPSSAASPPASSSSRTLRGGAKRWLPIVDRDLRALGYRTRALGIAASDVGAPHLRRRVFVVAYADGVTSRRAPRSKGAPTSSYPHAQEPRRMPFAARETHAGTGGAGAPPSNSERDTLREQRRRSRGTEGRGSAVPRVDGAHGSATDPVRLEEDVEQERQRDGERGAWNGGRDGGSPVPAVRRVDDGVPRGLDARRKRALGNAVIPQCAEVVGLIIQEMMQSIA
jgi:hypothetical protein